MSRSHPNARPLSLPGSGVFTTLAIALGIGAAASGCSPSALAQRAAPPSFVDDRRLPPTDAEIKLKAEQQRRQAAEAEARQKAEEQRRQAAEAEARQKAEEQRRQAAEAEAKQKAEEQRRRASEAEARQQAEETRHQAETEARQKAARAQVAAPAPTTVPAPAPTTVPAPAPAIAPTPPTPAGDCSADRIAARAISGGRVQIDIETPCRPNQKVLLRYGAFDLLRQLDGAGHGAFILDLFQGKSPAVSLRIGSGPAQPVSLDAVDMSGLSKVAVIWQAPVNLDLHVYEYAARHGESGHVWPGAPSSAAAAEAEARASKRGRGFLSTSDDGRGDGDKIEVYTFWHHAEQGSGLVATALDYETRGASPSADTCGAGPNASVVYESFILDPRGQLSRERGAIAPATCGSQLTGAGRYMEDAVPDLSAMP